MHLRRTVFRILPGLAFLQIVDIMTNNSMNGEPLMPLEIRPVDFLRESGLGQFTIILLVLGVVAFVAGFYESAVTLL